jgi:hypothetical protein
MHQFFTIIHAIFLLLALLYLAPQRIAFAQSCPSIGAPANIYPSDTTLPSTSFITWNSVPGAVKYQIRAVDLASLPTGCEHRGSNVCMDTTDTSYPYHFETGHSYKLWVHAVSSCGSVSSAKETTVKANTRVKITPSTTLQYYVSPNGNDSSDGSLNRPFKTIEHAQTVVRARNASQSMTQDIAIYLRQGYYQLSRPLTFTPADSGKNGFNIVYLAYPNETPVISGGITINSWIPEGKLWKSYVGPNVQSRQLYVNGVRATRARTSGGIPGVSKATNGFTTTDASMNTLTNQSRIEFVSNVYNNGHLLWKQLRCPIDQILGKTITVRQTCWNNILGVVGGEDQFFPTYMENAIEFLDTPGEWYLNESSGWVFYMPRNGESLNTAIGVLPTLETLISANGTVGNPVHHIVFQGITFAYATWRMPSTSEGFAHIQADYFISSKKPSANTPIGNWEEIPGNISFDHAERIQFKNNYFLHLGAVGLYIGQGSHYIDIVGNHFEDISASAIHIGNVDKPTTMDNAVITYNVNVSNNSIRRIGAEYSGSPGIFLGYVQHTNVSHNDIGDVPYSGISIGWGWQYIPSSVASNNSLTQNLVHDYVSMLNDGGGIYSIGAQPGNTYELNSLGSLPPNKSYGAAMYLDSGSRYIHVANNIYKTYFAAVVSSDITLGKNYDASNAPSTISLTAGLQPEYSFITNLPVFPKPIFSLPTTTPIVTRAPTSGSQKSGDLNADNHIDIFDYNILVSNFGKTGSAADIDKNGKVDIFDYNNFIAHYGK